MSSTVDLLIVYRIIKILSTTWKEQDAYKYGIINDRGKVLKHSSELKTREEKNSFTLLHRFVFNLKRLIEFIPGGKSRIGTYAAALLLLKEEMHCDELFELQLMEDGETGPAAPTNNIGSGAVDITPTWYPKTKKKVKKFVNDTN